MLISNLKYEKQKEYEYDLIEALSVPPAAKPALPGSAIEVVRKESFERDRTEQQITKPCLF